MKEKTLEDFYDLLELNNLKIIYCPNEVLGSSGPFFDVDKEILKELIIKHNNIFNQENKVTQSKDGDIETLKSGV